MPKYEYTIILTPAEEGGYIVDVPALPGCMTQGETREEALKMAKDAIEGYLECLIEDGEPVPDDTFTMERIKVTIG
ncbi:MAG: type II toxin-antitoxin system HicB family antitoxin [Candidatus Brocadiales bacterium]